MTGPGGTPGAVASRADFVEFVRALSATAAERPERWENVELPAYLEALAAWVEDMDGYFANRGEPAPADVPWRMVAQMLAAATVYE